MFIDIVKISVKAGNGGNGAVAWRREKYVPAGGPAGGDGGKGGDIIIKTDVNIRTLLDYRYKTHYKGERGEDGKPKKQFGKDGADIILKVPVGTLVKDTHSSRVIVDLKNPDESFVIAKGGRGGRGNARFATSTRQAPGFAENGRKGQEREITLELKLLADVGLVGFPNVGKSTILSIVSEAKPKIANYHFTTLKPNLGVVRIGEEKSFLMADIPGLIEGAGEGVGLGHEFLRHIERTRLICHVIDGSGFEGRNPIEDYKIIREELGVYNPKLSEKKEIIVINKIDIPSFENYKEEIEKEFRGREILYISAATNKGIDELKYKLWEALADIEPEYETYDEEYVEVFEEEEEKFTVEKIGDEYFVEGEFIERLLESIYFDDRDSLRYFQETLRRIGVVEELEKLGVQDGDDVVIAGYCFEFTF
ncbi:MAG: GTPase ObgE [Tissierellia bacterium]|nr:GTPase ObgE [Tissierellia bacterium]